MSSPPDEDPPPEQLEIWTQDRTNISAGYHVERIMMQVFGWPLLFLTLSQLLVHRFTPPRKATRSLVLVLWVTLVACVLTVSRGVDPTGVFNLLRIDVQHGLVDQVTACLIDAAIILMLAAARAVAVLMHRSLPSRLPLLMYGCAITYHLANLALWIAEMSLFPSAHHMVNVTGARLFVFDAMTLSVGVSNYICILKMRHEVAAYIESIDRQTVRGHDSAARSTNQESASGGQGAHGSAPASLVDKAAGPESISSPQPPLQSPQQQPHHTSPAMQTGGGALAAPLAPPFPVPASPTVIPPSVARLTPTPIPMHPTHNAASAAARVTNVRLAARKLNRTSFLLCVLLLLGFGTNVEPIYHFVRSETRLRDYAPTDASRFDVINFLYPMGQLFGAALVLWYIWHSPRVWISKQERRKAGSESFWHTLWHGLPNARVQPVAAMLLHNNQPAVGNKPPFVAAAVAAPVAKSEEGAFAATSAGSPPPGTAQLPFLSFGSMRVTDPAADGVPGAVAANGVTHLTLPSVCVDAADADAPSSLLSAPLDSAASHAPTGLSMRSGRTSIKAMRLDGDFYGATVDDSHYLVTQNMTDASSFYHANASMVEHTTHFRRTRHPFSIEEDSEEEINDLRPTAADDVIDNQQQQQQQPSSPSADFQP